MTSITGINNILAQSPQLSDTSQISKSTAGFGDMLSSIVDKANAAQDSGDQAITALQGGDSAYLHEVMIAVEEADVALRMLVQMRNKALAAYEEIMRMQI